MQLSISGIEIRIESDWPEIIEILTKDFWSFLNPGNFSSGPIDISIKIEKVNPSLDIPLESIAVMQTLNAISYDQDSKRYCDYYGSAGSRIDFASNDILIQGCDFDKIHEMAYLIILSRSGKMLDLKGFHKLHAMAISFEGHAFVCMMPSKGGKSTLLAELLKDPRVKMISDDIPLIDTLGRVHPFPLKIGLNEIPIEISIDNPEQNIYEMKREIYGTKTLISTRGLDSKIETGTIFKKVFLAEGFRYNSDSSKIVESTWLQTFKGLFKHGVIGIGSPIVIEYFWQMGVADFFIKTRIFFQRLFAFYILSLRARKVKIYSGSNPQKTALEIIRYLEKFCLQ